MKAWVTTDNCDPFDNELLMEPVIHAETEGKARAIVASEIGCDFTEATVRRFPAMDDLPATDWHLLLFQQVGWLGCAGGCNNRISAAPAYTDEASKKISPYVEEYDHDGNGDLIDESFYEARYMPLHVEGIGVFCSDACWQRFAEIRRALRAAS